MTSSTSSGASNALIRKSTDTELMPPPPVKRIKRPPKVLDEDSYTDALSEIIARDFFPGLHEAKHQQEYIDALESGDDAWIAEASRKLTEVMSTPQHRRGRGTSFATPRFRDPLVTPVHGSEPPEEKKPPPPIPPKDLNMSLDAFQSKYTSEDNASFNALLDKQNEKRRKAYAFLWNGNRIPGFRTQAHQKRLKAQAEADEASGGPQKQIVAPDTRLAVPNTWKAEPRNSLMFTPDTSPPPPEKSDLPPKAVVYANTRMPPPSAAPPERPPSPSASIIADAIAGRPRPTESEGGFGHVETPRVNGYSFVDSAPSPSPASLGAPPLTWGSVAAISDTKPAPSPFKIAATPKRELLHHKMVEKVAKGKRAAATPLRAATPGMTPKEREIPKFGSSPALTPAGQRLLGNLTGRRETGLRESLVKGGGTATPAKAGGRGFRWDPTPRATSK